MTGRSYAEQNGTSSSNEFMVKWTAPEVDSGSVTFYACGNGVDGNGSTTNDGAAINSLQLGEGLSSNTAQVELSAEMDIFPNPTSDWLNITLKAKENLVDARVQIMTMNGQIVHQEAIATSTTWNQSIHIANYANGLYLVQIQTAQGILTRKLVKN